MGSSKTTASIVLLLRAAALACVPGCGDRTGLIPRTDVGASPDGSECPSADSMAGAPSCAPGGPGMTTCGSSGDESCCTSLEVAGGTFYRTYDPIADGPSQRPILAADGGPADEADPATVSNFRLDKYLVTVGRFRQFVAAWNGGAGFVPPQGCGKHTHLNGGQGLANSGPGGGYETGWVASDDSNVSPTDYHLSCSEPNTDNATWTPSAASDETLPITCVNWYEAYAFCIWDGGFLPSDAEREYAAAGGSQQREYPWGSVEPGPDNQYAIYECSYPDGVASDCGYQKTENVSHIAPVGTATLGVGRWGQLDLAGEVDEWNLDWLGVGYAEPCTNCADLTSSPVQERVCGGGNWGYAALYLLASFGRGAAPTVRVLDAGFRCARTP